MSNRFILRCGNENVLEEKIAPYAIIECETEEDFLFLQEAVAQYKKKKAEAEKPKPLTVEELYSLVGKSVYASVSWAHFCSYDGPAFVVKSWSEGFCLNFEGRDHYFLNKRYGQDEGQRWVTFPLSAMASSLV